MVSHICLLVELGPICNSTAASLCLKSCVDHSLLKSYNGGLWKNIYRSGPICAGWSEPLLVENTSLLEISCHGSNMFAIVYVMLCMYACLISW